ncbi:hypothetical protein CRUP_020557 [Coryphaenoides rupestris]|nr:hypothetical protein CRUP_020557 [Coryphaenoides rupestris]
MRSLPAGLQKRGRVRVSKQKQEHHPVDKCRHTLTVSGGGDGLRSMPDELSSALNHVDSICSTWGRDHFKTFDGDMYQFSGLCSYNLVSDCHETYQEFSVHIQRNKVDGNPKVNEVVVTINDLVFHLTKSGVTLNNDA